MSGVEEFLKHHGVKGQKWGVRRKSTGGVSTPNHGRSTDSKTVKELKKKPASRLTNQQLKVANERMNLEQNFKRMNPSKIALGKKRVKGLLLTAIAAKTAFDLVNSQAGQAAISVGRKFVEGKSGRPLFVP